MTVFELINRDIDCACGKKHRCDIEHLAIGEGVLTQLPQMLSNKQHIVLVADRNTAPLCADQVKALLGDKIESFCLFEREELLVPDEITIATVEKHLTDKSDFILGIGSGVINDTCKYVSFYHHLTCGIIATAPSMDGYASGSSSMEREGLKVSLNSKCPDVVIGDADVLAKAPVHMIRSGIGDMAAKYISLVEWQIAALLIGEYYCPTVAQIVKESLAVCVENAKAAVAGEKEAVCRLAEGLVMSGLAMNYAGISRPASGMEHYISHILDMRALEFGSPADLHGIQCGIGTLITAEDYERLAQITPDREKELAYVKKQPEGGVLTAKATEAMEGCPVDAIEKHE